MFRGHFNIRSGIHGALVTRCHFELLSLGSLSANVTFQCPTGPTLLIVRHILSVKTRTNFWLGTHLLIILCIVLVSWHSAGVLLPTQ